MSLDSRRSLTIAPTVASASTLRSAVLAALNHLGVGVFRPSGDTAIWTPSVAGWSDQLHFEPLALDGSECTSATLIGDLRIARYCRWWDTHPMLRRA